MVAGHCFGRLTWLPRGHEKTLYKRVEFTRVSPHHSTRGRESELTLLPNEQVGLDLAVCH